MGYIQMNTYEIPNTYAIRKALTKLCNDSSCIGCSLNDNGTCILETMRENK